MKKKKPVIVSPEQVTVVEGRILDVNSRKKAEKRNKRYMAMGKFSVVLLFVTMLPISLDLLFHGGGGNTAALLLSPIGAFAAVFGAYHSAKGLSYTGRCGYEQLDENGSPFMGNLISPKGRMKPLTLLASVLMLAISVLYVLYYVQHMQMPEIRGIDVGGGSRLLHLGDTFKASMIATGVIANVYLICGEVYMAMFYGGKDFIQKIKLVFIGYGVPFLLFQIAITCFSALIFLLMTLLSDSADANAVVASVGKRVLDGAFDTTSLSGFLLGDSSIVSSLTTVSLFTSFTNTIIEKIEETQAQDRRSQLRDMLTDKENVRLAILLLVGVLYVGLNRFFGLSGFIGKLISIALFLLWLYTNVRVFLDVQPVRYIVTAFPFMAFDVVFPMPDVTDVRSFLLAALIFVARAAAFLTTGLLVGYFFRFIKDTSVLETDPEKKKVQAGAADITMEHIVAESLEEIREEERIKKEKREAFEKTAAGKATKVLKKAGAAVFRAWFNI